MLRGETVARAKDGNGRQDGEVWKLQIAGVRDQFKSMDPEFSSWSSLGRTSSLAGNTALEMVSLVARWRRRSLVLSEADEGQSLPESFDASARVCRLHPPLQGAFRPLGIAANSSRSRGATELAASEGPK